MQARFTFEQILSLASDKQTIRAVRNWATPDQWLSLERRDDVLWGCFRSRGKSQVEALAALRCPAFSCSCSGLKVPCSHALSLRLLYADAPEVFDIRAAESVPVKRTRADSTTALNVTVPTASFATEFSAAQKQLDAERLRTICAGLDELDLWLGDLVRSGLATLQSQKKNDWQQVAQRLVNAQLGEIAPMILALSKIPGSRPDWPDVVLAQAGRLHLLVEGFRRFATLSPEIQGDLRMAVGWIPRVEQKSGRLQKDVWHVMGRQMLQTGRRRRQTVWLWGEKSNRPAQVVRLIHRRQQNFVDFVPGSTVEGTCYFFPSQVPLRAELVQFEGSGQPERPIGGFASLAVATQKIHGALTRNPWQNSFPLFVPSAHVERKEGEWIVEDSTGVQMVLPPKFEHGWHLRALDSAPGLPLFGIWDRKVFTPLMLWHRKRWLSLHILKGQL